MSCTHRLHALSRRLPDGWIRAWLFARWLLILALVFDQVSAPFHGHHHDGVATQLEWTSFHDSHGEGGMSADVAEHPESSHAAAAIRADSRSVQLPAIDLDEAVALAKAGPEQFTGIECVEPMHRPPDRAEPGFQLHRSLPPAGRAPPLHA